jgi:hypothetical protein
MTRGPFHVCFFQFEFAGLQFQVVANSLPYSLLLYLMVFSVDCERWWWSVTVGPEDLNFDDAISGIGGVNNGFDDLWIVDSYRSRKQSTEKVRR